MNQKSNVGNVGVIVDNDYTNEGLDRQEQNIEKKKIKEIITGFFTATFGAFGATGSIWLVIVHTNPITICCSAVFGLGGLILVVKGGTYIFTTKTHRHEEALSQATATNKRLGQEWLEQSERASKVVYGVSSGMTKDNAFGALSQNSKALEKLNIGSQIDVLNQKSSFFDKVKSTIKHRGRLSDTDILDATDRTQRYEPRGYHITGLDNYLITNVYK